MTDIQMVFRANRSLIDAPPMEAYMKNQFTFLGIRAGERKKLVAEYLKENGAPQDLLGFTIALFAEEEREFQYVAIDLLSRYGKKQPSEAIKVYEQLIVTKSWWDTVDGLAGTVVSNHFKLYPELIPTYNEAWINGDNIWLARSNGNFISIEVQRRNRCSFTFFQLRKMAGFQRILYSKSDWMGAQTICKSRYRGSSSVCK